MHTFLRFYSIETLLTRIWTYVYIFSINLIRNFNQHQYVKYADIPVSLPMEKMLKAPRKTLVLDLDETLINTNWLQHNTRPILKPDFILKIEKDHHPIRFYVYKRPHVDYFLETVSKWYDVVAYTAGKQEYGYAVIDMLDNGRGIFKKRFYRQHCKYDSSKIPAKDLSLATDDLSKVFIIDNSPSSYKDFPDNAICIKSWTFKDTSDTELLNLLPFLDSLRFCNNVQSVLARNLHKTCLNKKP